MKKVFHRCMECDEIVTNPICSECLAKRMQVAVGEKNRKLAKEIKGISTFGETHCIFCGKSVGLCAHCFSKDIYEYLAEKNEELAKSFRSMFDFNLRTKIIDFE